jgi:hypothetical protein
LVLRTLRALITELAAIRARCAPRITTLASGQLPLVAMHTDAGRSLWQQSRHQPMAPILVSVLADGEGRLLRHQPPTTYQAFLELAGRRMARVLVEAYAQDGLLSYTELQWVFLASAETVSRALDHHQRILGVVLPCPGTVLDMGRMLTHKRLIVRLHLQGHTVLEIARATWHHPRSVDAYLKTFDAVLILHLYGLPPAAHRQRARARRVAHRRIPRADHRLPQRPRHDARPPAATRDQDPHSNIK